MIILQFKGERCSPSLDSHWGQAFGGQLSTGSVLGRYKVLQAEETSESLPFLSVYSILFQELSQSTPAGSAWTYCPGQASYSEDPMLISTSVSLSKPIHGLGVLLFPTWRKSKFLSPAQLKSITTVKFPCLFEFMPISLTEVLEWLEYKHTI